MNRSMFVMLTRPSQSGRPVRKRRNGLGGQKDRHPEARISQTKPLRLRPGLCLTEWTSKRTAKRTVAQFFTWAPHSWQAVGEAGAGFELRVAVTSPQPRL